MSGRLRMMRPGPEFERLARAARHRITFLTASGIIAWIGFGLWLATELIAHLRGH